MSNTLVVYFSASGETARLARTIAQAARADLCGSGPRSPIRPRTSTGTTPPAAPPWR